MTSKSEMKSSFYVNDLVGVFKRLIFFYQRLKKRDRNNLVFSDWLIYMLGENTYFIFTS